MALSILVLILIILASSPTLLLSSQDFPIAKPNCNHRCGNISIPFPFGTTPDCYASKSFWVSCNDTNSKLLFGNSTVEISDISLDGQIKIQQLIEKDCYHRNGTSSLKANGGIRLSDYYTVNNIANKFIMVGCDSYAIIFGRRLDRRNYSTGCIAMCSSEADLTEGVCSGAGCCQIPIPKDVSIVNIEVKTFYKYKNVSDFSNCGYGFVVEANSFNFSKDNLTNLSEVKRLPVVLDWTIRNGTCQEAESNASTYACVSPNSFCHKPEGSYGYQCHCSPGFEGNPYLAVGCLDIHECENNSDNCSENADCTNTPGDYYCTCHKGYDGDGRRKDGCNLRSEKQNMKIAYVLIGVACGIISLLLAIILSYMELKRRSSHSTKRRVFLQNGGILLQEKLSTRERTTDTVTIFSSSELEKATNGFHNSMIIGQGGFGTVYKGVLPDKKTVAIKKSIRVDPAQIDQFINEVFVLSQVNHRNVVRLLGCCLETDAPLLVYEFITNGTLSSHLHDEAKARVLDWNTRLKIAAETAGVLSYLHSSAANPIIHRDVKTDNILLDHTFTAKVADFGASKLVPLDLTQLSTMVQGTFGYLDPEYMLTNQLTEKSDVYSFGVVLLELVTGRRALSFDKPVEEKCLANYFLSVLKQGLLFEIVDDNIVFMGNREQINEVAKLAKECLRVSGEDRPCMKEVAMELEGLIHGGKHSWARKVDNDNVEEMESLLGNNGGFNHFGNGDMITSVGYDSIGDHIILPMEGGR